MNIIVALPTLIKYAAEYARKSTVKYFKRQQIKFETSNKDIENSISTHLKKVANWCDEVKFKDVQRAKTISDIFVDVDVYLMPRKNQLEKEEELKISSEIVFSNVNKHIVVLGQPGAGKTTLMKHICKSVLFDEDYYPDKFKFPILIRLRDFNVKTKNKQNENIIVNTLFKELGLALQYDSDKLNDNDVILAKERILIPILEKLNVVIILDGYDEIAHAQVKKGVIEDMKNLALSLNESRIILTSRSSDFNYVLDNVDVLEICPLSKSQIQEFAKKWLKDQNQVKEFLRGLYLSPFADAAIRPLTVAYLCAIYERTGHIPDQPKEVYDRVVRLLLEEWDQQRLIIRGSKYSHFGAYRKAEFLNHLSYILTTKKGLTTFSKRDLTEIYNEICHDYDLEKKEVSNVINEIETHSGLIISSGYDKFEFAHKSIQEYLCAVYLMKLPIIPNIKILMKIPNELAIAISVSSDSSMFFCELILNRFDNIGHILHGRYNRDKEAPTNYSYKVFISTFVNRLVLEKPEFNASHDISLSLLILYSYYVISESSQLTLFGEQIRADFESLMKSIYKRNKKNLLQLYDISDKKVIRYSDDENDLITLKKIENSTMDSKSFRRAPNNIYVRKAFLESFAV